MVRGLTSSAGILSARPTTMSDTQIASNTCWMMNEHLPLLPTQINSPLFISKLFHINCYLSILFGLIILKTFSLEKTIISFKHIMQNFKEQTQCPKMLKTFRFKNKCVSHSSRHPLQSTKCPHSPSPYTRWSWVRLPDLWEARISQQSWGDAFLTNS